MASKFSFSADLKNDPKDDGRLNRCNLGIFSEFHKNQLKDLTTTYIKALKENIQDRFDGNLPVVTAFEIFNPIRVPERKEPGFKEYVITKIKVLTDYFYQNSVDKLKEDQTEELLCEWQNFKYNLNLQNVHPSIYSNHIVFDKHYNKGVIGLTRTVCS